MNVDDEAGRRIRGLRRESGRSQADLVGPGLSRSYLSLIESGQRRPTIAALRLIADALGTTADYLATGQHDAPLAAAEEELIFAEVALHNGGGAEALKGFSAVIAALYGRPYEVSRRWMHRARAGRARALETLGRLDEAASEFDALWQEATPGTAKWAEFGVDVLRVHRVAGDLDYAAAVGERALERFEGLDLMWSDEAVRLGVTLSAVYLRRGDLARAAALLRRLISIAEDTGSPLARGSAYWNASVAARRRGHHTDALRHAERALALFGETDKARNLAQLHGMYATLLTEQGQPEAARPLLLAAHRELTETGSVIDIAICDNSLASAALMSGDLQQARDHAESALHRLTEDTAPAVRCRAHLLLAETHLAAGRTGTAIEALIAAETELENLAGWDAADTWQQVATVWERLGETEHALRAYRTALDHAGHGARRRPMSAPVEAFRASGTSAEPPEGPGCGQAEHRYAFHVRPWFQPFDVAQLPEAELHAKVHPLGISHMPHINPQ